MAQTKIALAPVGHVDLTDALAPGDAPVTRYTEAALARHKREGLVLAIRARWLALAVIAVMLPFLNPAIEVLYYEVLLACMALNGWFLLRVGRVGRSGLEILAIGLDLMLLTAALALPNPFSERDWPWAMSYQFGNFVYFFVILTGGTLAFSWRTILALGHWSAGLWLAAAGVVWFFAPLMPELTDAARAAFGGDPEMLKLMNPNEVAWDLRIQEVVVFLICAYTLALSVRRFDRLLLGNAALERERANLSRYFSPSMVEELSNNDDPLKQIRSHEVAVLFVDIQGFTAYAAKRPPEEVIATLRGFHGRMESEVFRHGGTLDKYMGDGLMATFGTPMPGPADACNALRCALEMIAALEQWNVERAARGEEIIVAGFGLHFGPVVLGDIGANRLEYAVLGNTVNIASRLETLTRALAAHLVISDEMCQRVRSEAEGDDGLLASLQCHEGQIIKGIDARMSVWALGRPNPA